MRRAVSDMMWPGSLAVATRDLLRPWRLRPCWELLVGLNLHLTRPFLCLTSNWCQDLPTHAAWPGLPVADLAYELLSPKICVWLLLVCCRENIWREVCTFSVWFWSSAYLGCKMFECVFEREKERGEESTYLIYHTIFLVKKKKRKKNLTTYCVSSFFYSITSRTGFMLNNL